MPVVHEYTDIEGFYILAVPYGLDTPVTYQVHESVADLFTEMGLKDNDRVSWSFLRPFIAIDQIYTQQSGVTDSTDIANNLSGLGADERAVAMEYFEQYFDLNSTQLEQLREFTNGVREALPRELSSELDSQLTENFSDRPVTRTDSESRARNKPIGNKDELMKYLSELFDLSESQIQTLEYFLQGDLAHISPGLGSELEEILVREGELSKAQARRERLVELLKTHLRDEFNEQSAVRLSLRDVPGQQGVNYFYGGGRHQLLGLSSDQAQAAKELIIQMDAELENEDDFPSGKMILFSLYTRPNHHKAEDEADYVIRALEYVYDADLTEVNRAHLTEIAYAMDTDDQSALLKPGWDDRDLNL